MSSSPSWPSMVSPTPFMELPGACSAATGPCVIESKLPSMPMLPP